MRHFLILNTDFRRGQRLRRPEKPQMRVTGCRGRQPLRVLRLFSRQTNDTLDMGHKTKRYILCQHCCNDNRQECDYKSTYFTNLPIIDYRLFVLCETNMIKHDAGYNKMNCKRQNAYAKNAIQQNSKTNI